MNKTKMTSQILKYDDPIRLSINDHDARSFQLDKSQVFRDNDVCYF